MFRLDMLRQVQELGVLHRHGPGQADRDRIGNKGNLDVGQRRLLMERHDWNTLGWMPLQTKVRPTKFTVGQKVLHQQLQRPTHV